MNARLPVRHPGDATLDATVRKFVREAVGGVKDSAVVTGGLGVLADVLVHRGTCPPVIDNGVTLDFASLSISAGSDHDAAMRFVSTSTGPFRVGDLPGLRPNSRQIWPEP